MRAPAPNDAADHVDAPTHCPACRSTDVKTASKVVNASSYWRCGSCGEVWNVERLRPIGRYSYDRSFR